MKRSNATEKYDPFESMKCECGSTACGLVHRDGRVWCEPCTVKELSKLHTETKKMREALEKIKKTCAHAGDKILLKRPAEWWHKYLKRVDSIVWGIARDALLKDGVVQEKENEKE